MKTKVNKALEARKWLLRGWRLTQAMAIAKWDLYRLAPVVERMNKPHRIVDNIGEKGKHAVYKLKYKRGSWEYYLHCSSVTSK